MSLLGIEKLTIRFGGLTAVNDLDLEVNQGEIFAVIGPNGAGKTTVFNAVTGVYEPTEGRILVEGRPPLREFSWRSALGLFSIAALSGIGATLIVNAEPLWDAVVNYNYIYQEPFPWGEAISDGFAYFREQPLRFSLAPFVGGFIVGLLGAFAVWRRARCGPDVVASKRVARTFQNIRLFQQMTVLENVLVGMETKLRTRFWHAAFRLPFFFREHRDSVRKAMEILAFVELDHLAPSVANSLPYGYQRRLEIARALASEPKLLLLDEPAAGMNPSESSDLMELIRKIRDTGISILLIEHDMKVVMGVSDRIAVLDYGNKIAQGNPQQIKADPQVRKAYLGTEAG